MTQPMLEIRKLSVNFRSKLGEGITRALDSIDLDIPKGEIFSIVGESGSGKTTLGRVVCGLTKPAEGSSIKIDGEEIDYDDRSERRKLWRKVQMVFQDPYSSFNPLAPIIDSLNTPILKYGIAKNPQDVKDILRTTLQEVGLEYLEVLARYPAELSGGQRQRASIARAMLARPEVLIADEPISMLDVSLRIGILNLIKSLNARHSLTIIFITHDLGAAQYLGGRTAVLYRGQIMEIAKPMELFESPANPYSQVLLDAAPKLATKEWLRDYESRLRDTKEMGHGGCSFYSRCPRAGSICSSNRPPLTSAVEGSERVVACHFPLIEKPRAVA